MRKILLKLVPNPGISIRRNSNDRLGLQLEVDISKTDTKLKGDRFLIRGPLTFNALPEELRLLDGSMETYKNKLDVQVSYHSQS